MPLFRPLSAAIAAILLAGGAGPLAAQKPAKLPRCDSPEFRQFDFWVGSWNVTMGGQRAGTNLVTLEEDGCVVHEHWTGVGGGTGQSFNFYDRGDDKWHQMWVSNSGGVLYLTGTFADGSLTLEGERKEADGRHLRHRLSFRPGPDGSVRQLWQTSADGGRSWTVSFDGLYKKG